MLIKRTDEKMGYKYWFESCIFSIVEFQILTSFEDLEYSGL